MIQPTLARWWRRRRARSRPVELLSVDEAVLAGLVGAALSGADPDEVTPSMAGPRWAPERIEWLRRFHRDRRLANRVTAVRRFD